MAVPWFQIVQLVPSIVDVSRELLKKNRRPPLEPDVPPSPGELVARVAALEENERRQAELVSQMAEQIAVLTKLAVQLRRRQLWLIGAAALATALAIIALWV